MTNRPVRRVGGGAARAGDDGGGGAQVHFNYGPLNRVVNVHWADAGPFVAAGYPNIYFGDTKGKKWKNLGHLQFDIFGSVYASAFAKVDKKRVFVLGGMVDDGQSSIAAGVSRLGAMILSSNDGETWSIAFESSAIITRTDSRTEWITGVVWDGTLFHATRFASVIQSSERYSEESLLASADGRIFDVVNTRRINDADSEPPSLIASYCIKPSNRNGIPDGYQAYNKSGEVFAKPHSLDKFTAYGLAYTGTDATAPDLEITAKDPTRAPGKNTSMDCRAVANVGSTWVAVGGRSTETTSEGRIDVASSGGEFTNILSVSQQEFNTVCGGAR